VALVEFEVGAGVEVKVTGLNSEETIDSTKSAAEETNEDEEADEEVEEGVEVCDVHAPVHWQECEGVWVVKAHALVFEEEEAEPAAAAATTPVAQE